MFPHGYNRVYLKKNGTSVEHVEWHQIKLPENFVEDENSLKKGLLIYVQGKIQTRQFTDEQQVKRYKTEILALQVQVLSNAIEPKYLLNDL